MTTFELMESAVLSGQRLSRGEVEEVLRNEPVVLVRLDDSHEGSLWCDLLQSGERPVALAARDRVLVWLPGGAQQRPVILGRIGSARDEAPLPTTDPDVDTVPSELVLEATKTLTLRVGDGSITIAADGRILIKGKDLVSHAQRVNRIKGGSVAIN